MSTETSRSVVAGSRRALSLGAALLLMASYLSVLQYVTDIAGGTERLVLFVVSSLLVATLFARFLPAVGALVVTALLSAVGVWLYIQALPNSELFLQSLDAVRGDILALLTGLSILRIMEAGVWAVAFAPAPTFLTWYFALRRRYVAAALVGGAALGFFVLTGDAGSVVVLAGVVGAAGVVGFGELDQYDGRAKQTEMLVVVLAAMVVVTPFVSVVSGGGADPLVSSNNGGSATLEASLLSSDSQLTIQGTISLSPKVRFTVNSSAPSYWRVATYDRYTGQGWIRTGGVHPYNGSLSEPPGNVTTIEQTIEVKTSMEILPAAWKPTALSSVPTDVRVTALGGVQPTSQLANGNRYTVVSQQPTWIPAELRAAGRDYPDNLKKRYTQLPESTPKRVARATERLTRQSDNPYETALIIERWLQGSKNYSLNVNRPNENIAASYLFEMKKGYCTYFATTMVVMLRTQGIPARFVTGYTTGQRVAENKWVVRGLNSHAWVEVYFPDVGWVRFDPTPAAPRIAVENAQLENARNANGSSVKAGIDTNASVNGTWTPTPTPDDSGQNGSGATRPENPRGSRSDLKQAIGNGPTGPSTQTRSLPQLQADQSRATTVGNSSDFIPELPSPTREQWAFSFVLLVGLAAGARRTGATGRAYHELRVRVSPRGSPAERTERAFSRLEYVLSREHRERQPDETPKQYLAAIGADERALRVGEIFEHAHYGGSVSSEDADEANALVDELLAERTPVLGRFR